MKKADASLDRTERWLHGRWETVESIKELNTGDLIRIYLASVQDYLRDYQGFFFHKVISCEKENEDFEVKFISFYLVSKTIH